MRKLAALAGLSPAYLSRIERGQWGLSDDVADRIEVALESAPFATTSIDGPTLHAAREARGLTLRQLADLVELNPGFVSRLERARRPVTPAIAQRLASVLDGTATLH